MNGTSERRNVPYTPNEFSFRHLISFTRLPGLRGATGPEAEAPAAEEAVAAESGYASVVAKAEPGLVEVRPPPPMSRALGLGAGSPAARSRR